MGWFPSAAKHKTCKHLQPWTHLKDSALTRQGPKIQVFWGKRHFWKRNRELALGKAKTYKFLLRLVGHLVLPPLVLWLLNGMRKKKFKTPWDVDSLLASSVLVWSNVLGQKRLCFQGKVCWGSLAELREWVVSLLLTLTETQPIPGVIWAHLADFLIWQECRTLLMQFDLLSCHQTFMILVLFWLFLISHI